MSRLLASLVLFAMPIAAQAPPDVVEYDFVSGGAVRLKLAAGEYPVRAGALPDRIRIRWSTREPEDRAKVRISSEIRGTEARVETRGPPLRAGFDSSRMDGCRAATPHSTYESNQKASSHEAFA